jgi:hypothetical protein
MNDRDPLIKGGQGRDEADLAFSAVVCGVCFLAFVLIGGIRILVAILS